MINEDENFVWALNENGVGAIAHKRADGKIGRLWLTAQSILEETKKEIYAYNKTEKSS